MPPRYRHYNLDTFGYEDFFEIEDMKKIVPVISFEEFQTRVDNVPDNYAVRITNIVVPRFRSGFLDSSKFRSKAVLLKFRISESCRDMMLKFQR